MAEFEDRLKQAQEQWDTRQESSSFESAVPDGVYEFQLQDGEIVESESSGRLQIKLEHLVISGEYKGETVYDYLQLETEWGPTFVDRWLKKMEEESPELVSDLPPIIDRILRKQPTYQGRLKTSKEGYQNLRITRVLSMDVANEPEPEAENPSKKAKKKKKKEKAGKSEPTREELLIFCQQQEIEVDDSSTRDDLVEELNGWDWTDDVKTMEASGVQLLKAIGIEV